MYEQMIDLKREHGWQITTSQLKMILTSESGKWPDDGVTPTKLGNTIVYVNPRNEKGKRTHRAMVVCAYCETHVSAGRLHQHIKVHKDKRA